ncbi:MAG TPA: ATP-binding protein [Chloroflexota bacterium]|nr:ATP-binding protein [Chloroflexota bacterium]
MAEHAGMRGDLPWSASTSSRLTELREVNEHLLISGLREQELAEALEAERAQLAVILAGIGDAVMVVDQAGTIVRANAAYARLAGGADASLAPEDAGGRPLPDDQTPRARAARGETFSLEFTLTASDGTQRWFEANGQPLSDHGAIHAVVVIRDITLSSQHRRLQNEFLDLAGHELRTPLTAVQGSLELLERWCRDADDARVPRIIATAGHQVRRLAVLVNDLMDVARLQSGKLTLTWAVVDLDALATEAVETARGLAAERTITLDAPAEPLPVRGDSGRLEQVLINLLTNAIKYTPPTARIDVRLHQVDGEAVLAVHDDGPGIAADKLPHLFERFYQIARSDRGSQGGMGLGLFISHQLVEQHGGRIAVASAPGEGTTFTIWLPLVRN